MATLRYAALLRGINVGGHRRVPMAALRDVLTGLGHTAVVTHLQSGNAAFTAAAGGEREITAALEDAIERRFGFRVDCLVRDGEYLRAVAEACPFDADGLAPKQLHITYFSAPVTPERFAAVDPAAFAPEEFRLGDRALYLHTPDGMGRSRLADVLARPALLTGLVATSRNWNTVRKLVELTR
ncbi:DUF1697 domain-containing protein [Streptomyces clavuligerus]|uniref:DUF1697 domain-containing protein n=1 Tax=Streptomyces clavuligerus TaxID=1901 RepID=B5H1K2_STRCL|nr:DUF1697 domain-containing protein [Streptomyces clavuligerus]ANW17536.1 hypothetical protein BB341_04490 [Streptomyces clavuligerus]AXU12081.1 DUF1697 domain-containing protein [Streptomyces clavuligerus]EDY52448.1 conserved hypothetical protein [Streptomyces clavuligerus]EFG09961.1 DUF1697 domain-containing protein [Streptomyces clavuligerus]MBY6301943.1 DUF1697 domain-containing protein [Streptomyces clavuligerus]